MKIANDELQLEIKNYWINQVQIYSIEQLNKDWDRRKRKASKWEKIQSIEETLTELQSIWIHTDQYLVEVWNNQTTERKNATDILTLQTIEEMIKPITIEWLKQKWVTQEELC